MRVVEQQPGADVRPLPAAVGQRVEERHRPDQVRRQPGEQQAALLQRLADQAEVEHLEVAQPAVDQLAAAAAGAAGQVALLEQSGGESAGDRVEGDAGADDAAADDQHVELVGAAWRPGSARARVRAVRAERARTPVHATGRSSRAGVTCATRGARLCVTVVHVRGRAACRCRCARACSPRWPPPSAPRTPSLTTSRSPRGAIVLSSDTRASRRVATAAAATPARRPRRTATLVMGGDLLWHNTVWESAAEDSTDRAREARYDFDPMFAGVRPLVSAPTSRCATRRCRSRRRRQPLAELPDLRRTARGRAPGSASFGLGRLHDRVQPQPRPGRSTGWCAPPTCSSGPGWRTSARSGRSPSGGSR